jgi:site-specific recombinase XerD
LKLKAVRQAMIESGLARTVVNRQVGRLRHVIAWAVGEELIPPTVYQALMAVRGLRRGKTSARETEPVKPVPDAHVDATIPYLSPTIAAMVKLQRITGARSTEICIMRTCDIDTSGNLWVYRPHFHKTQEYCNREIYLGPAAQEIIKPFLRTDLKAYIFSPKDSEAWRYSQAKTHRRPKQKPNPNASGRRLHERYNRTSYRQAIVTACNKAFPAPDPLGQIKGETLRAWENRLTPEQRAELRRWQKQNRWKPHALRHNAATRLRRQYGIEAARIILGHMSIAQTQVYAEADVARARQIMSEVG